MNILTIESTCDETAAAIVTDERGSAWRGRRFAR